jgi:hypothetical protein
VEDKHPGVMAFELHEEFIQHIEKGGSRLKLLSILTFFVSSFLITSYVFQLVFLPYVFGQKIQQVDLTDPLLVTFGIFLILISAVWLYVGVTNYIFVSRLTKQIKEIRMLQKQLEQKIS